MDNIVHNLIYSILDEIVVHGDNYSTKLSLILYSYFQMFYNIGSLFNKNTPITADRVIIPNWYNELFNQLQNIKDKQDLLQNMLYYGHNGFLSSIYPDFNKNKYKITDFGIKDMKLTNIIIERIILWGSNHYTSKQSELDKLTDSKYYTGFLADATGNTDFIPENPNKWINLIVPNGSYTENGLPVIDINADSTFKLQGFSCKDFWLNRGFSINPSNEPIIDLTPKICRSWETGLNTETETLLKIYENLDDRKKMISELFSQDNPESISIPGFWVIIAMMLSKKNNQTIENDIIMFFILGAGMYDASIAAWSYKSKYEQPRPISIIRLFLKEKKIVSWNPARSLQIEGKKWLPYQPLATVSPSHPDGADSNTVFSVVSGSLLEWWFNSLNLNNSFKLFSIHNPQLISPILNKQYKTFSIGEFCIEKGSSKIEPDITPAQTIVLKYASIKELVDDISLSSIYGGISWPHTREVSTELANWVYNKVRTKFETLFKIKTPYI
jgi:hypothetical protein